MENKQKPCRHEYVKIFQRKYKGLGRRLVSTRGYLPVGFNLKDFNHLSEGSFCFCTTCRLRLFPTKIDSAKLNRMALQKSNLPIENIMPSLLLSDDAQSKISEVWSQDLNEETIDGARNEMQEVNVEELQIEAVEVSDIANSNVIVDEDDDIEQGEGEE